MFPSSISISQLSISERGLYKENSKDVEDVLHNMATLPFIEIEQKEGGTQFKLHVEFPDGSQALVKPMRHPRSQVHYQKQQILHAIHITNISWFC